MSVPAPRAAEQRTAEQGTPPSAVSDLAAAVRVAGARGRARSRLEQIREADTPEELSRLSEIVEREVLMPLREVGCDHAAAAEAAAAAKHAAAAETRAASIQRRAQREREKQIDAYIRELQVLYLKTDLAYDPAVLNDLVSSMSFAISLRSCEKPAGRWRARIGS